MTHPNNIAYQQFSRLYVEAHEGENKSKQILVSEAMTYWKTYVKKSSKDPIDKNALDEKTRELRDKIETRKRRNSIQFCFLKQKLTNQSPVVKSKSVPQNLKLSSVFEEESAEVEQVETVATKIDVNKNHESDKTEINDNVSTFKRGSGDDETVMDEAAEQHSDVIKAAVPVTPKQDSLQDSINSVNSQILQLQDTSRLAILDDNTRKVVKGKIENTAKFKKNLEK